MSRIPPSLLYLTIYNPTLSPAHSVDADDEDAEEQAHILFYTARERAASRDRILRQVGLSKALVNFSSMFETTDACESTHSQTRRMVMVSPEPNFWIHACVELAKTPRPPKGKEPAKGKGKLKEPITPLDAAYEYHDGSVNDTVLREQILQGYEEFKVSHGSFSSILSSLGQVALELQLERFFTIWAWSWDLEDEVEFGHHLGLPLHPHHREIIPLLDHFAAEHIPGRISFLLEPPYLFPSNALLTSGYSAALPAHIMKRIPTPSSPARPTSSPPVSDTGGEKADTLRDLSMNKGDQKKPDFSKVLASHLINMDPRNLKWMWTGLTFGKGGSPKPTAPSTPAAGVFPAHSDGLTVPEENVQDIKQGSQEVQVDADLLRDAMASENVHLPSVDGSPAGGSPAEPSKSLTDESPPTLNAPHTPEKIVESAPDDGVNDHPLQPHPVAQDTKTSDHSSEKPVDPDVANGSQSEATRIPSRAASPQEATTQPQEAIPVFAYTTVFLPDPDKPSYTARRRVVHLTRGTSTFAFVAGEDDNFDPDQLAEHVVTLFDEVTTATKEAHERELEGSALTVTKILEPQDKHIISSGPYTSSSSNGFHSTAPNLFNARDILRSEFDVIEVFSRGQNPQHWHIGRRGLHVGGDDAEVYMEVARKESTLADVDNGLASIVSRMVSS